MTSFVIFPLNAMRLAFAVLCFSVVQAADIDCGCPATCNDAALGEKNDAPYTCLERINYLMSHYDLAEANACKTASAPPNGLDASHPCRSEACDPETCGSSLIIETQVTCGCPSSCDETELAAGYGDNPFTCKQRIHHLMHHYQKSEWDACVEASEQVLEDGVASCSPKCNPKKCGATPPVETNPKPPTPEPPTPESPTPVPPKPTSNSGTATTSNKIDCGCPATCNNVALGEKNEAPYTCLERIHYLMSHYDLAEANACQTASAPSNALDASHPCRAEACDPETCGSNLEIETTVTCGCPSSCDETELAAGYGDNPFTCKERIHHLMHHYQKSELEACQEASEQVLQDGMTSCSPKCNPKTCGANLPVDTTPEPPTPVPPTPALPTPEPPTPKPPTPITNEKSGNGMIDCGCPASCYGAALQETNGSPYTCQERIEYFMTHYGLGEANACKAASFRSNLQDESEPCRAEMCDPETCGSSLQVDTSLTCGCADTCDAAELNAGFGDNPFNCKERIYYLMHRYRKSELEACEEASSQSFPDGATACSPRCNPKMCVSPDDSSTTPNTLGAAGGGGDNSDESSTKGGKMLAVLFFLLAITGVFVFIKWRERNSAASKPADGGGDDYIGNSSAWQYTDDPTSSSSNTPSWQYSDNPRDSGRNLELTASHETPNII